MPGLKQTILDDLPVSFWSFDFDRRFINGDVIIDEIGNQNPMICQNDVRGANYWLEQQSLNPIETADQYALTVCKDGKVGGEWLEQFFEVVHTTAYDFPDNGEFSVEFLYHKPFATTIRNNGEPGSGTTTITPLIQKGSVIKVQLVEPWGGYRYLSVSVLGRSFTIDDSSTSDIFEKTNHVVVTYSVNQTDVNEYESTVRLYINGRLRGTNTQTHVDTLPVTATSASWLFCGDGGTNPATDFATEPLTMDQIAVYPYGLRDEQVMNHYRKTKQYEQMIIDDYPQRYWRLNEVHNPSTTSLSPTVGGIDGNYIGAVNRGHPGPERLVASHSPYFQAGGLAYIDHNDHSSRFSPIIDTSGSFTLELWFKSSTNDRAMMFDCSEETPPRWDGLRVYLNSKNNQHSPGSVQVSHTAEDRVNSLDLDGNGERYLFNDDEWHLLHVRYNNSTSTMDLYLDGYLHNSAVFDNYAIGKPGQITLMNSRPGDMPMEGHLSEMAFYKYVLSESQMYNRWAFTTRYKVSGFTLLQGAPVEAQLRFYDTITGELVHETLSNSQTGEYEYHPFNNRYLDVISKLPESHTTRYRVHGPVKPAEFNDDHLI